MQNFFRIWLWTLCGQRRNSRLPEVTWSSWNNGGKTVHGSLISDVRRAPQNVGDDVCFVHQPTFVRFVAREDLDWVTQTERSRGGGKVLRDIGGFYFWKFFYFLFVMWVYGLWYTAACPVTLLLNKCYLQTCWVGVKLILLSLKSFLGLLKLPPPHPHPRSPLGVSIARCWVSIAAVRAVSGGCHGADVLCWRCMCGCVCVCVCAEP